MVSNVDSPRGYTIYRPEKAGVIDILSLLIRRKSLSSYKFVETTESFKTAGVREDPWVIALTLLIQKTLTAISVPLKWIGYYLELFLNLLALNGGILGLLWHILTCSVVIPNRDSAEFRSLIGLIDGRVDLYEKSSEMNYFELMYPESSLADTNVLDLSMIASKIAYENPAYVEKTVTDHWKMHFVGFYNCWNKFLNDYTTQAFICCDKAEDASVIVLAFRGTEPFNANDWSTDVDLSTLLTNIKMGLGHIHLGFLKALGLQNELNFDLGFPKYYNGPDFLAYYKLREALSSLIKQHPNAKIIVTGHSLGGALAAIFPALLSYHGQSDILNAMYGVMTFGQPRVGDTLFATYMTTIVRLKFHRMVYRFDIVPRIPFDLPPAALFKHFGTCIYYSDWYKGEVVIADSPNPNYFDPLFTITMYFWAWIDVFRALFIGQTAGKDFREGYISILYRIFGLLIPGIASHSPRDYVNGGRLSQIANKIMV